MKPRITFNQGLQKVQDEVLALASMVDKAIGLSIEALKSRDMELAKQIVADDAKINKKRFDIEERCVQLIATQQPMAKDLRIIIAILNIIVDLERIGDHAEGIARIAIMIGDEPPLKPLIDIPRMAERTQEMLHKAIDSFVEHNADLARSVCQMDDEVDDLYNQVFRELLTFMLADPRTINRATRLIWAAHNLERSADRVTNICERVVFIVTGNIER